LDLSVEAMNALMSDGAYFAAPNGQMLVYSNYGYALLGRVISNVSGTTFEEFISAQLLQPLGMTRTSWTPLDGNHALPHRLRDGEVIADQPDLLGDGAFASMGGLWSTLDDLDKWTAFMLDAFPARSDEDVQPLRRSTRREMQKVWQMADTAGTSTKVGGYGMGLYSYDDQGVGRFVIHSGGLPGDGSNMLWLPERNASFVALANVTYAPMSSVNTALLEKLVEAHALPSVPQLEVPLLDVFANLLVGLFNQWDDERANEIFAMNVALDEPWEFRRAELAKLGRLKLRNVVAKTAASATAVVIDVDNKNLHWLSFSLSPQASPRVQQYRLTEMKIDAV
jgi:CubicO group peptidase (beta-lactamase class C family)